MIIPSEDNLTASGTSVYVSQSKGVARCRTEQKNSNTRSGNRCISRCTTGSGTTVDICRSCRSRHAGNGASRRVLVGHYPGPLMKCGQLSKRALWMGRGGTHTHLVSACIPSARATQLHPTDGGCGSWRMRHPASRDGLTPGH